MGTKDDNVEGDTPTGVKKVKFTFRQTKAFLTYKTHLPKEDYIRWLKEKTQREFKFLRLAHESGDEDNPYLHTHVLFHIAGKFIETKNSRYFDYGLDSTTGEPIHPHIVTFGVGIPGKSHYEKCVKYLSKEDPENVDLVDGLPTEKAWFERVTQCSSLQEALMQATKPGDAMGIKLMFDSKQKQSSRLSAWESLDYSWQRDAVTEFSQPVNKWNFRKIRWYVDFVGGCGKTTLSRYLYSTKPDCWLSCKDLGTSRDASTIVRNALENGWTAHGITIDLPRSAENHDRMYSYLEEIKDGFITATKYSGGSVVFPYPHLVVFSNWLPKFDKLSFDRWDIRLLERVGDDVVSKPYTFTKEDLSAEQPRIDTPTVKSIYGNMPGLTF